MAGLMAVLREEWRASRARIRMTSIAIAAVTLGAAAVNILAYITRAPLTFFCVAAYAAAFVCFALIPFYAWSRGSGNLHAVLFGETAPLALLVPVRAAPLLLGRQLVNLAEYLIYAVSAFVYLLLMAPTSTFLFHTFFPNDRYHMGVYWETTRDFFVNVFHNEWRGTVHITLMCAVFFLAVQATLNCAAAIYSAFVHTQKTARPNRFLMFVIIAALFYLPMRVGTLGLDRIVIERLDYAYRVWPYLARLAGFAALYFVLTAYLIEKKVEVW